VDTPVGRDAIVAAGRTIPCAVRRFRGPARRRRRKERRAALPTARSARGSRWSGERAAAGPTTSGAAMTSGSDCRSRPARARGTTLTRNTALGDRSNSGAIRSGTSSGYWEAVPLGLGFQIPGAPGIQRNVALQEKLGLADVTDLVAEAEAAGPSQRHTISQSAAPSAKTEIVVVIPPAPARRIVARPGRSRSSLQASGRQSDRLH
jgi:hypothetical protein